MEKKITKRERYEALLSIPEVANDSGMVEFIEHEIELLNRKSSSERKPTAAQIENEALMFQLRQEMMPDVLYSVTDMLKNFSCCENISTTQKITALVGKLVKAGLVERVPDKRKVYFRIISKD